MKFLLIPDRAPHSRLSASALSIAIFILGSIVLRGLSVAAWAFFPGGDLFQQLARVLIPLAMTIGLVLLNRALLRRDGLPSDSLRLGFRHAGWFLVGILCIAPIILAMAGALWLIVPFHWQDGPLRLPQFGWQAAEYLVGNFAEELIFRGYLLLALARSLGPQRALLIVALLFGIFHLPGLTGLAAIKMICTTALGSYLFAYGYLLTGSLWTAVGMHAFGNLLLYQVLGFSGGAALLAPVFQGPWPSQFDPAFWVWVLVSGVAVGAATVLHQRRSPSGPAPART